MKKIALTLVMILGITTQLFAMSTSNIRNHARFISDRMAYELDLNPMQYDDCYEINYDFIYAASQIMDDVVYGYYDAIDRYYRLLDYRNEDMRYVLNSYQYNKYLNLDYFYRPIYSSGRDWYFRIYTIYSNRTFFFYDAPTHYKTYRGGHSNRNHYDKRYSHETYKSNARILGSANYNNHNRNDFGTVRRDRNDKQKNSINNYKNPNQPNRTQDTRYQDRSGNQNSPMINHRQNTSQPTINRQGDKQQGGNQGNKPADNTRKSDNKQGGNQQGVNRTGRR